MRIFQSSLSAVLSLSVLLPAAAWAVDVKLHGELVEDPCVVNVRSAEQQVAFDTLAARYFYSHPRSNVKKFDILLEQCDLSLGKTVELSFSGEEDKTQPGLLAISGEAKGIAIGLETEQGEPLDINRGKARFVLQSGNTLLSLQAYLHAAKENIEQQSVQEGQFSAIATFNLNYN